MEVGIEDCLHIEFEFPKSHYSLKECLLGKVSFILVKINIKYMEINIIKRETTGTDSSAKTQSDDVAKFQIMDGCPFRKEVIPIRLFLKGYEFTPTFSNVNNKFSTRYFVNLVLVDEDERRYFKQ